MEEFEKDFKRLVDCAEDFNQKYGGSVVVAASTQVDEDHVACPVLIKGGSALELHMLCHSLLKSERFVDEIIDAIKCILKHVNPRKDDFSSDLMERSMDSLKKLLMLVAFQERLKEDKSTDEVVKDFLDAFYHGEGN